MADRASDCRIAASAYRGWESFDVPHLITDVVDAIFELPPVRRPETRLKRLPAILNYLHAEVFDRHFVMFGHKNADGEWAIISEIHPTGPTTV